MRVIHGIDAVTPPLDGSVLTIGNFDGVHRAHQQLLAQAGLFAVEANVPVVVLTFEPHPLTIVAPDKAPARLSPVDEKLRLLAVAGANVCVVARSDPALLAVEPERFVEDIVWKVFHPSRIVEGPSFGFGRGRRGNAEMLRELAAPHGCDVHIVEPVTLQVQPGETLLVSSSLIRRLIAEGKVHRAALCLGRPYTLIGDVVRGDGRGRTIGFPTANLDITDQLIPGDGVYSGHATVGDKSYACAISIGPAATFGVSERRVEAHLLDYSGDLYGARIRVSFLRLLRAQQRFESPAALVEQLHRDVQTVRDGEEEVTG